MQSIRFSHETRNAIRFWTVSGSRCADIKRGIAPRSSRNKSRRVRPVLAQNSGRLLFPVTYPHGRKCTSGRKLYGSSVGLFVALVMDRIKFQLDAERQTITLSAVGQSTYKIRFRFPTNSPRVRETIACTRDGRKLLPGYEVRNRLSWKHSGFRTAIHENVTRRIKQPNENNNNGDQSRSRGLTSRA